MSDYLSSLLDRYQPQMPVIQPRLPSLFEPEPALVASTALGMNDFSEVPLAVEKELAPSTTTQSKRQNRQPIPVNAEGSEAEHAHSQPTLFGSKKAALPATESPKQVAAPISQASTPVPTNFVRSSQAPLDQVIVAPRNSENRLSTSLASSKPQDSLVKPSAAPSLPALSPPIESVKERIIIQSNLVSTQPATRQGEQVNPVVVPDRLPPPSLSLGQLIPKIEPKPAAGEQATGILLAPILPIFAAPGPQLAQAEPVINVTIGRIEVRANVQTPSSKAKPANRQPPMELNEYLQRRGGGQS